MADEPLRCPECGSEHTYELAGFTVCSMCAHEWDPTQASSATEDAAEPVIRDSVGNVLADGDTVTVVKNLKVKGASAPIKAGTKVKGIRLVSGVGDHDIDCRVDGFGPMQLKSSVVKKA
ncbi:MAG: alkylphosphonate utilization protein [Solirubrobacterales bacterium]|nr:alkylphosphonate utilization protein [Solirubrobacterales bacterium]